MKRSLITKLILVSVAVLMMFSVSACTTDAPKNTNEGTVATKGTQSTADVTKEYLPEDYDAVEGFTIKILTRTSTNGNWNLKDIAAEGIINEPINDATFERNEFLKAKYGFTVEQIPTVNTTAQTAVDIENINKSGIETYHAVAIDAAATAAPLTRAGHLVDLTTISTLDLEQDFWDQRFIENMTIGGKLFSVVGDISITYYDVAWIQLFNKDLLIEKGIDESVGNPYDFVNNGTWTLDVMNQMAAIAAEDLNGDGTRDKVNDRFGYIGAYFNNLALYYAGGNSIIGKNADDLPVVDMFSTQATETIEAIKEFLSDKNTVLYTTIPAENANIFNAGRGLFINAQMMTVRNNHRSSEYDFGVVPTPKIDASQENYSNIVSTMSTVFAIPTSNEHLEETGFILNALAYKSQDTVIPAYFDTTFSIVTRDTESEEALKKIMDGAYFDLSFMFNVGNWNKILTDGMEKLDFASEYDSQKDKMESDIEELIAAIDNIVS